MKLALASAFNAALDPGRRDAFIDDIEDDEAGVSVDGINANTSDVLGFPSIPGALGSVHSALSKRSLLEASTSNTIATSQHETIADIEEKNAVLEPERLAVLIRDFPLAGGSIYLGARIKLAELRVIVLAGVPLDSSCLRATLMARPINLEKLDVSYCQLRHASWPSAWASLFKLSVLWLHGNFLGAWEDVRAVVACPALTWLTLFENPIAGQPEYRDVVISEAPQILALDTWVVTDDERVKIRFQPVAGGRRLSRDISMSCRSRFVAGNDKSVLSLRTKPQIEKPSSVEMLQEASHELNVLKQQAIDCSAARFLQACWTGHTSREASAREKSLKTYVATRIQNAFRAWRWRRSMIDYTKDYLQEIDALDLLLSTQDRIRQHAQKLIDNTVRAWVRRRKERKQFRDAGIRLTRIARGFLTRVNIARKIFHLKNCTRIYFPEEYAWEFLALLNVVRRQHHLEVLPYGYTFEDADMLAVRMPEGVDMPARNAVLTKVLSIRNASLIRRCPSGRFPEHPWDGPRHSLAEGRSAPDRMHLAHSLLRRRAASVNNYCRQCFLESCAAGEHPIHRKKNEKLQPGIRSHFVSKFLKAGGERKSFAADSGNAQVSRLLDCFLQEARLLGAPHVRVLRSSGQSMDIGHGGKHNKDGDANYGSAVWLSQRLLSYKCESAEFAHCLICVLARFQGTTGHVPIVKSVPFLPERMIQEACAFATIQALWRAHHARCSLPCSLIGAAVMRRAALCIQRCWRWSILKRRFQLLRGVLQAYQNVNTSYLYIEERVFLALNLINSISRYAPLLLERSLGFGCMGGPANMALVRADGSDREPRSRANASTQSRLRTHGLPTWLWKSLGDLHVTGPDETPLRTVCGLQGLLLEGLNYEPNESNMIPVTHAAERSGYASLAGETLRFVELRFPSVSAAKLRAAALHMCTWSSRHRLAVPLLPKPMIYSSTVAEDILRLWDIYSLTWQQGDRLAISLLRQRCQKYVSDIVPACGREHWSTAARSEWLVADAKVWSSTRHRSNPVADIKHRPSIRFSTLPVVRSGRLSVASTASSAVASVAGSGRTSTLSTSLPMEGEKTSPQPGSIGRLNRESLLAKASDTPKNAESEREMIIPLPTSGTPRPNSRTSILGSGRPRPSSSSSHVKERYSAPLPRHRSGASDILLPAPKARRHTRK